MKKFALAEEECLKLESLKSVPGRAFVDYLFNLTRNLELIKYTGVLEVDISDVNGNYQKILTKEIKIYSINRIRDMEHKKEYGIGVFFYQTYRENMDCLIDT